MPARGAGSNPAVPTLQWMEILRFVTFIPRIPRRDAGNFCMQKFGKKGGVAGWQN